MVSSGYHTYDISYLLSQICALRRARGRKSMEQKLCSGDHPHHDFKNFELDYDTLYDLSEFFKVFGDSTRISILAVLLKEGELCVCDIAERGSAAHISPVQKSLQRNIIIPADFFYEGSRNPVCRV